MSTKLRVGSQRIISIRYRMKNSAGNILVDTFEGTPVDFLYGSGEIIPGLEGPLTGLKTGEQKNFSLSSENVPGLDQTYHFDVIIDDVRWESDIPSEPQKTNSADCGPNCEC